MELLVSKRFSLIKVRMQKTINRAIDHNQALKLNGILV